MRRDLCYFKICECARDLLFYFDKKSRIAAAKIYKSRNNMCQLERFVVLILKEGSNRRKE